MTAIASLLSVLAVAVGLVITNNYNRAQQALAVQGQITDRFTKAVEQLGQAGAHKIDVRMGAIYSLRRIMRDSEADQAAVVEILCAFIRVHAPAPDSPTDLLATRLPPDIQAAMSVLARRVPERGDEGQLDLSMSDLGRVVLPSARLRGTNFMGSDLEDADMRGADLSGSVLDAAYLRHADLSGANLAGAKLKATASSVILRGADLHGADLSGADLQDADLRGADLSGAVMFSADLTGADLACVTTDGATVFPPESDLSGDIASGGEPCD